MATKESSRKWTARVWVPLVLVIGLLAGLLLSFVPTPSGGGPPPNGGFPRMNSYEDFSLLLSTVDLALLVALLVVFVPMYLDTSANFAAGLVVVLSALLVETFAGSPLLFHVFGIPAGGLAPFLLVAEVFKAVALTVFLYLSLQ